jgi:hypothetical protein
MSLGSVVLLGVVVASTATCSSTTEPRSLPTVRVVNAMCDAGHCATLEIRAFVWKFKVPQPPHGREMLADIPPGETCITFPRSWSLTIIGPDTTGRMDTTTTTWTPADPIYLVAADSAVFYSGRSNLPWDSSKGPSPYDGLFPGTVGETPNFTPGDAGGWTVTFPNLARPGSLWSANIVRGPPCKG